MNIDFNKLLNFVTKTEKEDCYSSKEIFFNNSMSREGYRLN